MGNIRSVTEVKSSRVCWIPKAIHRTPATGDSFKGAADDGPSTVPMPQTKPLQEFIHLSPDFVFNTVQEGVYSYSHQTEVHGPFLLGCIDGKQNHDANIEANPTGAGKDTTHDFCVDIRRGAAQRGRSHEDYTGAQIEPFHTKEAVDLA